MPLEKLLNFTTSVADFADKPPGGTATQVKAQFDAAAEELRTYFNAAIDILLSTTTGDSGAKAIGAETIAGLTGNDVQTLLVALKTLIDTKSNSIDVISKTELQSTTDSTSGADKVKATPIATSPDTVQGILEWLKAQIDTMVLGQIPDGSLTDDKLSNDPANIKQVFIAHKADDTTDAHLAKNIGLEDASGIFIATELEGAMTELFTNVSNGKALVGTAITDVDSSVTVPTEPTFQDLATSIGSISTGKKIASGTGTGGSTSFTINSLDFTPSKVIITLTQGSNFQNIVLSNSAEFYEPSPWSGGKYGFYTYYNGSSHSVSYLQANDNSRIIANGFIVNTMVGTSPAYKWWAFE